MRRIQIPRSRWTVGSLVASVVVATSLVAAVPAGAVLSVPGRPGSSSLIDLTFLGASSGAYNQVATDSAGHVYFTETNGALYRVDSSGANLTKLLNGLGADAGLAMGPDGNLWVGNNTTDTVESYNPTTHVATNLTTLGLGFPPTSIAFDGLGHVFIGSSFSWSGAGAIYRYNLDFTHRITLVSGVDPWGIAYDHNGHIYWANGYAADGGFRVNTDGTNVQSVISSAGPMEGVMVLPDHNVLWGSYGSGELFLTNANGSMSFTEASFGSAQNCTLDNSNGNIYCMSYDSGLWKLRFDPNVVASSGSATVSWSASAPGSSPTTSYTVTAMPIGGGTSFVQTVAGTQLSTTFYGLQNGTEYTFNVYGTNDVGDSPRSLDAMVTMPGPVAPNAPTGTVASKLSGGAKVSWSASVINGSPVTAYMVTAFKTNSWTVAERITVPGTVTSATLGGLVNGQSYRFNVSALSNAGDSPLSSLTSPVIPVGPPSWSSAPVATALSKAAKVQWSAANANGSPITGYKVTAYPSGKTCLTTTLTCTVVGLSPGVTYAFKVTATNHIGTSAPSPASNSIVAKA